MARAGLTAAVAGPLLRLFGGGSVVGLDERELLDRFIARRDPVAFEAIVARHGPMVLGVCRRWLDDPNDADDAFQATFLVLVRRAKDLRDRDLLANWLYGVATKVARRARQQARTRRDREARAGLERGRSEAQAMRSDDLGPDLHEELARLPHAYRSAVILCDLEGRTHEEAARELGWPIGTVKGRLSRARDLLRDRLARRGVGATSAVLATALEAQVIAVPPALLDSTVKAALAAGAGKMVVAGTVSASVAKLTEEALATMFLNKLATFGAVGLLATGTAIGGTAAYARYGGAATTREAAAVPPRGQGFGGAADGSPKGQAVRPDPPAATSASVDSLETIRMDRAQKAFEALRNAHANGQLTIDRVILASERLRDAQIAADGDVTQVQAAWQSHISRLETLSKSIQAAFAKGAGSEPDKAETEAAIAEAKYQLAHPSSKPIAGQAGISGNSMGGFGGGGSVVDAEEEARLRKAKSKFFEALDNDPKTQAILQKLGGVYSFPFEAPTPLEEVLKYIGTVTTDNVLLPKGIPFYFVPIEGMDNPDEALRPGVAFAVEGVPLRTALRLILKHQGLVYVVKEGLVIISEPDSSNLIDEIERSAAGMAKAQPIGSFPAAALAPGPVMSTSAAGGGFQDDPGGASNGGIGALGGDETLDPRYEAAKRQFFRGVDDEPETNLVVDKLNAFYAFPFENDAPLEEVIKYIQQVTADDDLPDGIPVYFDEVGMQESQEATPASSVKFGMKRARLRTALRLMLQQLRLVFIVKDGILIISSPEGLAEEIEIGPDEPMRELPRSKRGGFR